MKVVVSSDSNAAKSFASRRGLGKQRHVQTRYLWIQERVAANDINIVKVPGGENTADILTKVTPGTLLHKHMGAMGVHRVTKKNKLQKNISGITLPRSSSSTISVDKSELGESGSSQKQVRWNPDCSNFQRTKSILKRTGRKQR